MYCICVFGGVGLLARLWLKGLRYHYETFRLDRNWLWNRYVNFRVRYGIKHVLNQKQVYWAGWVSIKWTAQDTSCFGALLLLTFWNVYRLQRIKKCQYYFVSIKTSIRPSGSWRHNVLDLSIHSFVTKLANTIFWKQMNLFWWQLTEVVHRARAWNVQLWGSGGQRSRSHEANRFGGLVEASVSTPFGLWYLF